MAELAIHLMPRSFTICSKEDRTTMVSVNFVMGNPASHIDTLERFSKASMPLCLQSRCRGIDLRDAILEDAWLADPGKRLSGEASARVGKPPPATAGEVHFSAHTGRLSLPGLHERDSGP